MICDRCGLPVEFLVRPGLADTPTHVDVEASIEAAGNHYPRVPDLAIRTLSWDWREQPDLDVLARHIRDLSGGALLLHTVDTGSDECAIVLSTAPLNEDSVRVAYERDRGSSSGL